MKEHPFFNALDWDALLRKEVPAPCALGEMFSEMPLPKASTREQRVDRLQAEFTTYVGVDEEVLELGLGSEKAHGWNLESTERSSNGSLGPRSDRDSRETLGTSSSALRLELTSRGAIWAISHSLVRALGYNQLDKQQLLGRPMLDPQGASLVETADIDKFVDAFEKAREVLDDCLAQVKQQQVDEPGQESRDERREGRNTREYLAVSSEVTVWLRTAGGGRMCVQASFEVVALESSFAVDTGGPAGLVVLDMRDVTMAEGRKEIVRRRYELAYNLKAPDCELIDFFDAHADPHLFEESKKSVHQPVGHHARSPSGSLPTGGNAVISTAEISSGVRAYLERRRVLLIAFPDINFNMFEQTTKTEGERTTVYTSWQWAGTHLGPYTIGHRHVGGAENEDDDEVEMPPSCARVHTHGVSVDVFSAHGKIVDHSVFYDEAAIRAQLELKTTGSRGRDTRSIVRRALDNRASNNSPITVQLYLTVRKQLGGGDVAVGAMVRPVVFTAPRYSYLELEMMETMDEYFASKMVGLVAEFATDGFCLIEGQQRSSREVAIAPAVPLRRTQSDPNGDMSAGTKSEERSSPELTPDVQTSIILCSHAFARILHRPADKLLRADLCKILSQALSSTTTGPAVAERLAEAVARGEPFRCVFEAHMSGEEASATAHTEAPHGTPHGTPDGHPHGPPQGAEGDRGEAPAQPATNQSPGRVLVLDLAPFVFEQRNYFSVILSDVSDDLVLHNVDFEGRKPLTDLVSHDSDPAADAKSRRGGPQPRTELADRFIHCVPRSWRWFGGKNFLAAFTTALHASQVGISISDMRGEDSPLVWMSEGFYRLNGFSRIQAIGRNCRFLQCDASDFGAVYEMRRVMNKRIHTRVYLWNEALGGEGFWTLLTLRPGSHDALDEQPRGSTLGTDTTVSDSDARARYMAGVQYRLSKVEMRFIFERTIAYRMAHWVRPVHPPEACSSTLQEPCPLDASPSLACTEPPRMGPVAPKTSQVQLQDRARRVPSHDLHPLRQHARHQLRLQLAAGVGGVPVVSFESRPEPSPPIEEPPPDALLISPSSRASVDLEAALSAWGHEYARVQGRLPTREDAAMGARQLAMKLGWEPGGSC